jgi:hypothetical protein
MNTSWIWSIKQNIKRKNKLVARDQKEKNTEGLFAYLRSDFWK